MKSSFLVGVLILLVCTTLGCTFNPVNQDKSTDTTPKQEQEVVLNTQQAEKNEHLNIVDKPVLITDYRKQLARQYAKLHYGTEMDTISPQAIVLHWTASRDWQSVYHFFYPEECNSPEYVKQGKLNLTSHFLVDRDGTIYQLTPNNFLNRHAIGLNWCSIGIENVGGVGGKEDLTDAQVNANIELIKHLKQKYPSIGYVLGHYQQDNSKEVGLWKEEIAGYYTGKPDPGPIFMQQVITGIKDTQVKTFKP